MEGSRWPRAPLEKEHTVVSALGMRTAFKLPGVHKLIPETTLLL